MSENKETPEVDVDLQNVETFARSNASNLPPQFNGDPEKYIKSWKDQRAEITRLQQAAKKQDAPASPPPAAATEPAKAPDNLAIPTKPEPAKPTDDEWNKWGQEISATGNVSDDSRNAIKNKYGIPDQILNAYVDGARAQLRQKAEEAAKVVGGVEELNAIRQWASENLEDAERDAVNISLAMPGWQNVILGLKARREASNTEPKARVQTVAGVPAGLKPFASSKEMVAAMRDPRYKFDSEYQRMVQDRVRASGVLKND